jgi:putative drug exporter of the RND superfamily
MNPLSWLTDFAVSQRGRWITVIFWLILAGILGSVAPKLSDYYNDQAATSIGDQESVRAAQIIKQAFPQDDGIPAIIVLNDPQGLNDADKAAVTQISCWLLTPEQRTASNCPDVSNKPARPSEIGPVLSTFTVPQAASQLVSANNQATTIIVTLKVPASDTTSIGKVVSVLQDFTSQFTHQNTRLTIKVTGPAGILADLISIFKSADFVLLAITILLVLILLIIIYRSPILAILLLIGVGWALAIVTGILGFTARAGLFPVSQQPTSIMNVLLFGAGTDYAIFIAARYREELHREQQHIIALQHAMRGVGAAITSSAGTVILSLLTLVLAILGLYSSLGWVLVIAIAVMLAVGLTLIPALLSIIGRVAFWPFIPKVSTDQEIATRSATENLHGFWATMARFVTSRPLVAVVGSVVLLGLLALGDIGVAADYNSLTDLSKPTQSTDGYKLLASQFEPGTLAPFNVVIHFTNGADAYQQLVAIDQIDQAVSSVKHIAEVTGPTRPDGKTPTITPADLQQGFAQLPEELKKAIRSGQISTSTNGSIPDVPQFDPRLIGLYAATVSSISDDGHTVLLQVTMNIDPYSKDALDTMQPVRDAAHHAATMAGLPADVVSVQLDGVTPRLADTRAVSDRDTRLVVPLVLLLVAIVLGLLLRSVIAPLYLLAAVTLNYFAALGATSLIFTKIMGDAGLPYATPLYTFIFLVALGADYTIFLMSRVREETSQRGLRDGVQVALTRTGGVITSAGLILAGTFMVLAALPLRTLYIFGTAVAIGILLDTFVVRGLLVPGTVVLLKKWNWWPSRLQAK